jgi:hypothetical protein
MLHFYSNIYISLFYDLISGQILQLNASGHLFLIALVIIKAQYSQKVILVDDYLTVFWYAEPLTSLQQPYLIDIQLDLVGRLWNNLFWLPFCLEQLHYDLLVLPWIKGSGPIVLLALVINNLRYRSALNTGFLQRVYYVFLLVVQIIESFCYLAFIPVISFSDIASLQQKL